MIYMNGVSRLGFGCMRLGNDFEKSERLILKAVAAGINYFDTAYIYPGNEELLGKIIEKNNLRDKVYIATKIPHYLIKKPEDIERIFQTQLERLRTDHIDYYLMHMLPDVKTWDRLRSLGIEAWIEEKKAQGKIGHIGFSYHGNSENHKALIDAYDWEFTMVQYNYIDEHTQAGRSAVEYANAKGVPVFVMEPLRGGRLAEKLSPDTKKLIAAAKPRRTPAEWALRWLWDQESVSLVLSGMKEESVLDENVKTVNEAQAGCLSEEERAFYGDLTKSIRAAMKVGCTGCGYCIPCPFGVNIPACFNNYNLSYTEGFKKGIKEYFMVTAFSQKPAYASLCKACGKCAKHCPQGIPIPEVLPKVKKRLEIPGFKLARWIVRKKLLKQ